MRKLIHSIWTQLWLTGVVCLVLLALYTSLGRQLMPLIETKKVDIENALSAQLGINVSMETLQGDWFWFSPRILVNQFVIGDREKGFLVEHLEAELDVSASLFYRVPVFDSILLSGVQVPITQSEDLNWKIGNFSLPTSTKPKSTPNVSFWQGEKPLWLTLLGQQGEIQLQDWHLEVQHFGKPLKAINLLDVTLKNNGLQHWLDGKVQLAESGAILKTQLEVVGDLWDLSQQNGKGFIELENQSWQDWIPDTHSQWKLEDISLGAKLWVEVENGMLHSLDGYIDIPDFSLSKTDQTSTKNLSFEQGHITLVGRRDKRDWHLWFDTDLKWLSEFSLPKPRGRISWFPSKGDRFQVALSNIDLEQTANLVEDFNLFKPVYMDYITHLKPKGLVDEVRVNIIPEQDWLWSADLNIFDVSIEPWNGIPSAKQLNADITINATGGVLNIRDSDTYLHFPKLYDDGWLLKNTTTDIFWKIEKDYLKLAAPSIRADLEGTKLNGSFSSYTPLKNSSLEPQLNLMFGIQNLNLLEKNTLIPTTIPTKIYTWLDQNIKSGLANQASFIFAGSVDKEVAPFSQSIQLYADINHAQISYMPKWPEVEDIKASLMIDVPNVDVWVQKANTLGGKLVKNSMRLKVRTTKEKETWLTVSGKLEGAASEGIKYLQETPLKTVVNNAFKDWDVKGDLSSELYARLSLSGSEKRNKIRLSSQLNRVDIAMKDLKLDFSNINGQIIFDSEEGLSASDLAIEGFLGQGIANIHSTKLDDSFDISIDVSGDAKVSSIKKWMPLFILKPMSGAMNYDLSFLIRPQERGGLELTLNSDLTGVGISVPAPFGKSIEQPVPFRMSVNKHKDLRISFKYGDLANGVISLEDGELQRGQIYLGTVLAYLPSDKGLSISGNIAHTLDAKAWWDLWADIKPRNTKKESINNATPSSNTKESSVLSYVNISAPNINAWGQRMGATQVEGRYEWGRWNFDLESQLTKGKIMMPDDLDREAIEMDLEYIHMPVSNTTASEEIRFGSEGHVDILDDFDPQIIPNLDLKISEMFIGTNNFGRWDMSIRQQDDFTKITVNDSDSKKLTMKGDIYWSKDEQGHKTHLKLFRISTKDLGGAQRAFRKVPSVEAKNSKFDLDLAWQGSPIGFNYASLNGLVKVSIKDGILISDNAGALKAFGVLNFNTISRRLQLDFSDLYEDGVVFDILKTRLSIENGLTTFVDPLLIDGPSAKFQSTGWVNLNTENINQNLVVTFPVTSSLPLVAVLAGFAPQVAGAIYVTEKLIGEELERFTSASYTITGTIEEPKMVIDRAFDNKVEGKESRSFKNRFLDIFGLGDDE